ncbi:N-acetylglucosaminyl-diphospho-decaprenol L-rhamnosyltransferase [Microterricola gilva]|uniref:N-acetylglucosaminyl-diphospho-decaprenol L-rhamnosyltransferase n=1 Tax=Microterricola gilva TaxID=393267 RepID=A0A4V6MGH9_9MICO|nr:glycosyltransferase family 2 protein [Microterricola gilva]RZU64346.1 N-acetylglucosaminyl-diphospho-decaprenol L-rhamnosyltransferase [Microterricola gilva]
MSRSVLVVTVTYNSGDTLRTFLESLHSASSQRELDVVVVDNASPHLSSEREAADQFNARFLSLPENLGYGGGITAGVLAAHSDSEYILITNPDVTFRAGAIDVLADAADRLADAGAVGPTILDEDGTVYPSARNVPSLRNGIGHALFARLWPQNPWTKRYRADAEHATGQREAGWLSGACLLVRREAYDAINGFDPSFFMYFEDVDLGTRLGKAGWKNVYVPEAVVVHTGAHSTVKSASRMERAHHDSAYLYLSRKYSAWYLAPLRWALRMGLNARRWWVTR